MGLIFNLALRPMEDITPNIINQYLALRYRPTLKSFIKCDIASALARGNEILLPEILSPEWERDVTS